MTLLWDKEKWAISHLEGISTPICNQCKHFKLSNVSCTAYPGGIPDQILENLIDHRKPFIGDNGIQFEKK